MSIIRQELARLVHFFRSGPTPCPYIAGQIERKLFTRLTGPNGAALNSTLTRAGFRRSHDVLYRPVCPACQACVPVRVPAARFTPNRTQRRTLQANADLAMSERLPEPTDEQFLLFRRYQMARHGSSDMARMGDADYAAMVRDGGSGASLFEFRRQDDQSLLGVMLADRLTDGFSLVYSFFEPEERRRGLGIQMIMALIEQARTEELDHVYLGFWIEESRKMAYKATLRPLEALTDRGWQERPADGTASPGTAGSSSDQTELSPTIRAAGRGDLTGRKI